MFMSSNGPYTFFIGANPFSEEALLCCYNAGGVGGGYA